MAISRSIQAARAEIGRLLDTRAGQYNRFWAHVAGCMGAAVVLFVAIRMQWLAGARFRWSRLGLLLAELAAYAAVTLLWVVVARRVNPPPPPVPQVQQPQPTPPQPEQPLDQDCIYLNKRRVSDSLATLGQSLAQEEAVKIGTIIEGGIVVRGDLIGIGLDLAAKREMIKEVTQTYVLQPFDQYLKLRKFLQIRQISDDSPTTLVQQTFWDFPLVDVKHVSADTEALHAVGRVDHLNRSAWFRIDKEWRREKHDSEFRDRLTVVAQAIESRLSDELSRQLPSGIEPPTLRLRPLAIHHWPGH